ncbi:amino acid adenylation, partial [Lindgomyces ingoldianus]
MSIESCPARLSNMLRQPIITNANITFERAAFQCPDRAGFEIFHGLDLDSITERLQLMPKHFDTRTASQSRPPRIRLGLFRAQQGVPGKLVPTAERKDTGMFNILYAFQMPIILGSTELVHLRQLLYADGGSSVDCFCDSILTQHPSAIAFVERHCGTAVGTMPRSTSSTDISAAPRGSAMINNICSLAFDVHHAHHLLRHLSILTHTVGPGIQHERTRRNVGRLVLEDELWITLFRPPRKESLARSHFLTVHHLFSRRARSQSSLKLGARSLATIHLANGAASVHSNRSKRPKSEIEPWNSLAGSKQYFTPGPHLLPCTISSDEELPNIFFKPLSLQFYINFTNDKKKKKHQLSRYQMVSVQVGDIGLEALQGMEGEDFQDVWRRNQVVPESVEQCVHELIKTIAQRTPNSIAIHAWDGEMTYGELDAMSTKLAGHLVWLGVKQEAIVPLCFEKSMWTVVAMLAVLKAGGAFVPLNPEHPRNRHEEIFDQTGATVMLTSAQYATLWEHANHTVATVSGPSIDRLVSKVDVNLPVVKTSNAAYVIFTSGSTGTPKGVVLEHGAISTSCVNHGEAFELTPHTRALQFASYTFDACITEIITTLVFGGCVCVPSEGDRGNNLVKAINTMAVNWALLTPTVARLLEPKEIPTLDILVLGGEAVTYNDCQRWDSYVKVINTYGPTECSVWCTSYHGTQSFKSGTIGKSIASVSWVVDPEDHNKLPPVGSIGELLIEGPILARGYLNDAGKTNAAFIDDPAWLLEGGEGHPGRHGRMYKTGDLVYYRPDGNLVYVGRKDEQVKVRGQRVELGEIEHHLRECIPEVKLMTVEVIMLKGQNQNAMLAAFLQWDVELENAVLADMATETSSLARVILPVEADKKLAERLPGYMVPEVYFAVAQLPMTVSGKTDRKRLREIGASFSAQQLAEMRTSSQGPKRLPSTEAEKAMQQLWARVLGIEPESIGLDDSFFRLGGDSIAAMKLVSEARRMGLHLSVADIFRHPTLSALAGLDYHHSDSAAEDIPPFSLLGEVVDGATIREEAAVSCSVDAGLVEDLYPCSPLQEGLVSLTSKRAGDYIMQGVLELRSDIDEEAFRAAWGHVVRSMTVLRTRIVQNSKLGLLQAVIAEDIRWTEAKELEEYLEKDKSVSMGLGDPLTRYTIVKEAQGGRRWMVWTVHHALYDGWSLPRVIDAVTKAYTEGVVEQQPGFHAFAKYLSQQDHEAAAAYWHAALTDCQAAPFPPLPAVVQQPVADAMMDYQCPPLPKAPSDTTTSTLIHAAWAVIASRYTNSDDVVFGTTVTGRNAPVAGIEAMIGPTIATVPVRVRVAGKQTVSAFLKALQQQATDMIPYEQTGLQRIAKVGAGARHACGFQTLLVVQPARDAARSDQLLGELLDRSELQEFSTYGLMLQCTLAAEGIRITASFDERAVEEWLVKKLLDQFSYIMQQLARADPETIIADINALTPGDREELWASNREIPAAVDRCVHDLFEEQARARSEAPAVCAWDGELTYSELDALSTRLASHLVGLGVKPEDIVPLCFEKSMWTVVAMLAVLKAGGAFASLNPEHPRTRHEEILKQTGATLILTSTQCSLLWKFTARSVFAVSESTINKLPLQTGELHSTVTANNAAYVIFTSGSTGIPKGVVLEHQALSTSCLNHGKALGFTPYTRALQFASYTFDACVAEILTTLVHGGGVCVPSEDSRRNDLTNTINSMNVNWLFLTPSVARVIDPTEVPSLTTLALGGEWVDHVDWKKWMNHAEMMTVYGPTECCIFSSACFRPLEFKSGTIGKSIASVSWVVDPEDHNKLHPVGSIGELLIEGPILARGYLNDIEKTNAAFINDPAWLLEGGEGHPGRHGRMYKTGDLVYYGPGGNLVYVGRKDEQVKVRGQRVELGEIEHHLRECIPEVKLMTVEVIMPKGQNQNAMLAAFLQLDVKIESALLTDKPTETSSLARVIFPVEADKKLAERLPGYMVPDVYFAVAQLPMMASGKTDRKRLREIGASFSAQQLAEMRTSSQGPKRLPSTEIEKAMQQLWARVLGIEPESIGLDDSFFRLGGDSIEAMKLVGEARRMEVQLSVADIFRNPGLDQLASAAIGFADSTVSTIPHIDHVGPAEQSFAQGRLWFLEQLYPGLNWYLMPFAVRIRGPLQLTALNTALLAIESRHETLRTTFATNGGVSVQMVQPFRAKELNVIDILPDDERGLADAVQQDQTTPFDLRNEPGWRVSVYQIQKNDHLLSIVMHHIVSDGWSVDVLMRELAAFYSAAMRSQDPLSQVHPLPIQYRDFSVWQRQKPQVEEHQRQLSYWLTQLQGSRPAELLCDKPRPATLSGKADMRTLEISGPLYAELQEFCKAHGVTLFVALLAAFRATHFRLTGQDDATIGTANANRDRWEVKDIIGFFVNMQCLRITIHDESFEELVQQVHAVAVASLSNQDVPFESIVSQLKPDRDLSRHPLVQLVFAVHSQRNLGQLILEGVETESMHVSVTSRFDLEFHFFQEPSGLQGNVFFSTDLYAPETIDNMLSLFHNILQVSLREPKTAVASLPLLTKAQYSRLDRMGLVQIEQTNYPRDLSIVDLFIQQASAHPSRIAVTDASAEMSYAELDRESDLLARWLVRRLFPPESLVGVLSSRSCQTIVAFLGILKANLAYLPFDVKIPGKRMEAILSSLPGQRVILLGSGVQAPKVKLSNIEFVRITEVLNQQANDDSVGYRSAMAIGPSATSLAYVMFTSGSTGQPKGVMVEHRGIVRLVRDNNLVQHLPASRVMAHMTNLAFDVSTWEIYACLLNGGTLVCIDAMIVLDPDAIAEIFNQRSIQMAVLTPALFRQYTLESSSIFATIEMLCVGGEAMYPKDYFAAERSLTGISATFVLHKEEKFTNGVPIGRALSNSGAYVMDPEMRLVPLGVIGELVVTGDGLARGYIEPQGDIDRFVTVTVAGRMVRAYRTGDYVRHRPTDGLLEFFGRMDGQIKIRGNRVELGEIEHILRSHSSVSDAVTVLQQHDNDEVRLTGFVTIHEDDALADEAGAAPESQHVEAWEEQFDVDIYSPIHNVRPGTIGRDFIGWTSMYDGTDIDKAEMSEWLDDTIATLLNGQEPGNVLEIGSGTGMVLFNVCKGLQSYVGLEPSQKAVDFITATVKSMPALAGKVHMYKATAADVGQLEWPITANLVVMNSVVQYFPSQAYLFKLIQDIIALEGVRTLFFGDIRSYTLYREFLATRALRIAGDKATKAEILRMMADMERGERELLVDPAFFTALPSRLPGLIEHVEILPKKMKATNELSCYRYAVVVHIRARGHPEHDIHYIEQERWIDFAERKLDRQSLLEQLHSSSTSPLVAVSNIPYSKTIVSRCLVALLDTAASETTAQQDWLSSVYKEAHHVPALSAIDLVDLAEETGYQVEISWSRQHSQKGGLDAVFHRYQPQDGGKRVMFQFPGDDADRLLQSLSSRPLRQQYLQKTQQQLHKMLEAQLPTYMVPQSITVLNAMPINQNGKVDRKMLAQRQQKETSTQGIKGQQELSTAQSTMQQLWARALGIEAQRIDLDDSFFRLGGDSIAAMKLVGEARRMGMHLSVADIFRNPTLAGLAGLDYSYSGSASEEILPFSLLGKEVAVAAARAEAAVSCSVDAGLVKDLYPCSPLQEGLVSLTSKRAGDYIMQGVLELLAEIDEEAFRAAWEHVFRSMEVLRTRIVQNSHLGLLQAVIAEDISWLEAEGLEEYLKKDKSVSMGLGDPLTRYAIVTEEKGEKRWMVWTVHHALYDGWSLPQIIDVVTKAYTDGMVEQRPGFHTFIKYLNQQDQEVATRYWKNALHDCQATPFPPLPSAVQQPFANAMIDCQCPPLPKAPSNTTTATLVRAAWSIIISRYTNSDDVVFGTTVTGRNAPVAGIEAMVGPTIATVPVRVRVAGDQTVSAFLQRLQQQATDMIPYEQTGLQRIAKMSAGARHACDFQTLLVVQPASDAPGSNRVLGEWRGRSELQDFSTYGLMLQCTLSADGIHITASFDRRVVEEWLVKKVLSQFSFIMQQLARAQPEEKVADMDPLTLEERTELWASNRKTPAAVERCAHDLFAEQVREQPDAPAICSWDGEMTYGELDALSTRLARHLVRLGVKLEDIVPLCFEKSMWTVVAMLAVLKAGGVFVPLDPNHPVSRHREIFKQTRATVVLASKQCSMVWKSTGPAVFSVSESAINKLPLHGDLIHSTVTANNAAYVIFTSGSTGIPKGVVLEHRALSTSCLNHGKVLGFTPYTRALQFASYTFDACITEIITTLVFGGCVCVPSENDRRNNLAKAINTMDVNWALLTPSVAQLLEPQSILTLKTLLLGGETVSYRDLLRWSDVNLVSAYGPAECCIMCTAHMVSQDYVSGTIGKSIASVSWVVDREDHNRLAPIGSIGELLIEGPILARCYLDDAEKTTAAFVNDPTWLLEGGVGHPGRQGRMYKTGDLVYYGPGGNLVYMGRKDDQVKVRGQRVELGEIEHHLRECMPEVKLMTVEVITPKGQNQNAMLAAFLQLDVEIESALLTDKPTETSSLARVIFPVEADKKLAERLPGYMVPDVYFAVAQLPMMASGKTDRKRLREIGA